MIELSTSRFRYEHLLASSKNLEAIQNFKVSKKSGKLPEEELIKYYKTLGFSRLDPEMEDFVHKHVKPRYDAGCYFMYQII